MLIRNATLADGRTRDVRTSGETIAAVAETLDPREDERVVDATGKRLLPGMIDVHVHFRQPGFGHKETWETGTKSAAAGGVTTVVDQPNTEPPTVDGAAFDEKLACAEAAHVDFGINGGVTPDWDPESLFDRPLFALGEVFLADSTGEMAVDVSRFVDALDRAGGRDVTVTVHAENAALFNQSAREREDADAWSAYRRARAEVDAVRRACDLAAERDVPIHVAHTSTPRGIDIAAETGMTCEVTPHHMFLSRADLDKLGTHGVMNPPLRRERLRQGVYERVVDGTVDVVATDHAPHTAAEKDAGIWEAPSGVPGVETVLPLLLYEARRNNLSYERVRDLTATNPAAIFDLPRRGTVAEGNVADLVLVDPDDVTEISASNLHTNCDWTPFEGWHGIFPEWTMVRGQIVYERGADEPFGDPRGTNVRTLEPTDGPASVAVSEATATDPADETAAEESADEPSPATNGTSQPD
jgi:dihydroorotase